MPRTLRRAAESGLSLIELMIAMVLALLVAAGIISVFISTSSSNRVQTQLASLQETGRFAISRMDGDLAMANGQYCTNNGGIAKPQLASSGTYLDGLRAPSVYASNLTGGMYDVTTPMGGSSGGNTYPTDPGAKYTFPSFLSMRGYDCTTTACTPIDPHDAIAAIPAMGTALDDRVPGTAVLTVRYINPSRGWTIGPGRSSIAGSGNVLSSITLNPDTTIGEPPASDFRNGDLAMLADCSNAQIFAADDASGVISPNTANNHGKPAMQQPSSAPKLFDFTRDFQTVTYYVKLVSINNDGTAPYTGALYRRVNGGAANPGGSEDEIARGIERLDFKYGVENANGTTSFLTAAQVDASTAANCPPPAPTPLSTTDPGCLWRSVKSIEVSMLVDGQQPLYTLSADEMNYIYSLDGSGNALAAPSAHTIKPSDQGFVNQMLRRQFTALVSLRNFNP
ncbi:PilW family protein [Rhodanobacter aciditrophus]|uniref:PilW family protein n=1 Tax=Rhodanobacter aciditrophus TaxID=1623218 RepID=UPI003CF93A40